MKKISCLAMLLFACTLLLAGCAASSAAPDELQRLAQLEVYSADGQLLRTVTDTDTLLQFNRLACAELAVQGEQQLPDEPPQTGDFPALCTFVTYKTSAARFHKNTLEKEMELTVYAGSSLVQVQFAPSAIKGLPLPHEHLLFYTAVSADCIEFLLSLAEK